MFDQGSRLSERHQIGGWPWTSHLISLCFVFLTCHMRTVIVLVLLGYCNKIPWKLMNNRNLFLTVLEAGSLKSGCQRGGVRALFQIQTPFGSLTWQKVLGTSLDSFMRALTPFTRALSSRLSHFPKVPHTHIITFWG